MGKVFFSEIDKHANTLLNYHYPDVCNLGDIREVRYGGTVDIIVGGTPCQSVEQFGIKERDWLKNAVNWSGSFFEKETRFPIGFFPGPKMSRTVVRTDSNDFGRIIQRWGNFGMGKHTECFTLTYFGSASRRRRLLGLECNRGANFATDKILFDGSFKTRNPAAKSPKYPLLDASTYGRKWQSNRSGYEMLTHLLTKRNCEQQISGTYDD